MSATYRFILKTARVLPRIQKHQWFKIAAICFVLIVVSAIAAQSLALWQTVIPGIGKASGQSLQVNKSSRLYILSEIPRPDGFVGSVAGRVTVLDLMTRQAIYSINTGVDVDASLSADGSHLYIVGIDASANCDHGEDHLFAVDARTGTEIWRVSIKDRIKYNGGGPSTLIPSPDGRWLYLYSSPWCDLQKGPDGQVPYWLQVVDTRTGQVLPDTIPLSSCGGASLTIAPTGGDLYVTCFGSNDVRFINLQSRQVEQQLKVPGAPAFLGIPGGIAGSVASPDSHRLYIVTDDFQVAVVDLEQRTVAQWIDLGRRNYRAVAIGLVALSADGTKLVVGENIQEKPGTDTATKLHLFNTGTWQKIRDFRIERPITHLTLVVHPDGRSVYGIGSSFNGRPLPDSDTILNLSLTGNQGEAPLVRKGEGIMRIFIGP